MAMQQAMAERAPGPQGIQGGIETGQGGGWQGEVDNAAPQQQGVGRYGGTMAPRYRMMQQQQGQVQRPYGQEQGFGQGYRMPRRQVGGEHYPSWARQASPGQGYSPRTAGQFGGRPRQMNQMQAMTRPAFSPAAYNRQPWGGTRAVPRQQMNY